MYFKKKQVNLDEDTKQYIQKIRWVQICVFAIMIGAFVWLGYRAVGNTSQGLKKVAVVEVEEAMRETVNNTIIQIDLIRVRNQKEIEIHIEEIAARIKANGISDVEEMADYLKVSEENELGHCVEAIFIDRQRTHFYLRAYDTAVIEIDKEEKDKLCQKTAVCKSVFVDGKEIVLFARQKAVDKVVKDEIYKYIHASQYTGNQYIWVNEIINMNGGANYAIRKIHPNMPETEGEYLSTSMKDTKGNYPYIVELDGIKEDGEIFHSYYFKNKLDDEIQEKFSYAKYYEPFNWIVATGETIEEVYEYAADLNERNIANMVGIMATVILLMALLFGMIIKLVGIQALGYRKKMWKQVELVESIYETVSVGLLRVSMTDEESKVIKINPKGLELLGVDSIDELLFRFKGHIVDSMNEEEAQSIVEACKNLKNQWDSVVAECHVTWKDGSVHLLRIRNTLVEMNGDIKIIQKMCQDITDERRQHENELMEVVEKASLDPMTQIKNKKAIEQLIRDDIKEAGEKNISIAVGFVDIDNFKNYNTLYGHLQGDEVIKYVAHTLRDNIRGVVGRNGGDEFSFCMLNPTKEELEETMKCIHKKLNEGLPLLETGEVIPTPCSIGIAIGQKKGLEYSAVIEQADKAMYHAKERGKNTYHILKM